MSISEISRRLEIDKKTVRTALFKGDDYYAFCRRLFASS